MRCWAALAVSLLLLSTTQCTKAADPNSVEYWSEQASNDANRIRALKELGQLGKPEAVPVLIEYLNEPGPWQVTAVSQLAVLGDPNAVPSLVAHISYEAAGEAPELSSKVRLNQEIVRALGALHAKTAVDPLLKLLSSRDPSTRGLVLAALGTLQAQQATEPLLALMRDPNALPAHAQAAVRALGEIGAQQAVQPLIVALYNESLYDDAQIALVQIGKPAFAPLIRTVERKNSEIEALHISDDLADGTIESHAASVLGYMRAQEAAPAVAAAFNRLLALYAANPHAAPAGLSKGVGDLAESLGRLGGVDCLAGLLALLKVPNDDLRLAAAEGLVLAGPQPGAAKALFAAAHAGPPEAREEIIESLSRLAPPDLLPEFDGLPRAAASKDVSATLLSDIVEAARDRLVAARECQRDVPCWRRGLHNTNVAMRERAIYETGWRGDVLAVPDLLRILDGDSPQPSMAAVISLHRLLLAKQPSSAPKNRVVLDTSAIDKLQVVAWEWGQRVLLADSLRELRALIARCKSVDPA